VLPIEIWFNGVEEMPAATKEAFEAIPGVACRNIKDYIHHEYMRRFFGDALASAAVERFEIKPFAALFSHFRQILLLDSDNIPIRDPVRTPITACVTYFVSRRSLVARTWFCVVDIFI